MRKAREEAWRVFCAVEVPQPVREVVLRHIDSLRASVPDAKAGWCREANIHLTLKFLGDIPTEAVTRLSSAAARAVANLGPFPVQFKDTGVFPNQRQPRVLWIGVTDASDKLTELHTRLEEEAATEAFEREGRRFHPHLTVARLRQPGSARALAEAHLRLDFVPMEIQVSELLVIRSELSSAGSKYTVISKHSLGATDLAN